MPPVYHDGREENHRCIAFCEPIVMPLNDLAAMRRPRNDRSSGTLAHRERLALRNCASAYAERLSSTSAPSSAKKQ